MLAAHALDVRSSPKSGHFVRRKLIAGETIVWLRGAKLNHNS